MTYTTKSGHEIREGDLIFSHLTETTTDHLFSYSPNVLRVKSIDGNFAEVQQAFNGQMESVQHGYGLRAYSLDYAVPFTRENLAKRIADVETLFARVLANHRRLALDMGVAI